jgi:hypothetical protein
MVKIPNMGNLVDRLKSGIEEIGVNLNKMEAGTVKSTDPIVMQFEAVQASLAAMVEAHAVQTKLIEHARAQLNTLTKTVAALQELQTQVTPPAEKKE